MSVEVVRVHLGVCEVSTKSLQTKIMHVKSSWRLGACLLAVKSLGRIWGPTGGHEVLMTSLRTSIVTTKPLKSLVRERQLRRSFEDLKDQQNVCEVIMIWIGFVRTVILLDHTFFGASLTKHLPILCAHTFACNWQQPFLNQRKEENVTGKQKYCRSTRTFLGWLNGPVEWYVEPSDY